MEGGQEDWRMHIAKAWVQAAFCGLYAWVLGLFVNEEEKVLWWICNGLNLFMAISVLGFHHFCHHTEADETRTNNYLTEKKLADVRLVHGSFQVGLFCLLTGINTQFDFQESPAVVLMKILFWLLITANIMMELVFLQGFRKAIAVIFPVAEGTTV